MNIEKHFSRNPLSAKEKADMNDLYSHAKMFAAHIMRVTPPGVETDLAIYKLKEVLGYCEMSMQQNNKLSPQVEMPFCDDEAKCAAPDVNTIVEHAAKRMAEIAAHAQNDLMKTAAHARR